MKYNNKLPYRERVRHAAYRDTYTQRSEEIQIRKEIKRMEKDKAPANEPPLSEKERTMNSKQSAWISVDERLPETEEKYLVCTTNGNIGVGSFIDYYGKGTHLCFDCWAVTHWMPLPEPPKGSGNDKQTHGS